MKLILVHVAFFGALALLQPLAWLFGTALIVAVLAFCFWGLFGGKA
jgi:hypothetical protein